ncbi:DUF2865 domain-containing protein [Methylobacterium gnaphalii]|uniref:DUF2865 domain-containing protein n=1 Tax=Methylobacterium gnaphalii TaxID=1010610 RepID=A0A512JG78_9HYPH|nr:DUF2865 domain-containing protein [Methylobacterium gnaphalii]GEP08964.1 hypothetical protein MGN01_08090 [Methylobacterium gnaphalii]GJD67507.1 hypothetical protein MMMDOFMJ_0422 [Methylobacterium gnaphalii]GLS48197.1 hypothetical protein GCM10007885_10410 [Methylobacterium gnaphalii]
MLLIPSTIRRSVVAAVAVLSAGTVLPAAANPFACQRYKAELASLNDNGSTQRALQSEIGRLESYYRSLNCEGGKFLFFDTRPPQCGAVEQRIRALNAGYGAQNGEVVAARRRQLIAAIGTACADVPALPTDGSPIQQTARGGHKVICVKTCDGSYFPMNNLPDGRSGADEMCQALCPGTQAVAYSMPEGDEALRSAATIKGNRAYTSLATAFKFRTSFEPNCSCKREGQSWAQSLAKAESMLVRHKGDIFVTPMQAERLSRPPKVRLTLVGRADKTAATLAADAASRTGAAGETAGDVTATGTAGPADASTVVAKANTDRTAVRVIEPSMIPVPARTGTP